MNKFVPGEKCEWIIPWLDNERMRRIHRTCIYINVACVYIHITCIIYSIFASTLILYWTSSIWVNGITSGGYSLKYLEIFCRNLILILYYKFFTFLFAFISSSMCSSWTSLQSIDHLFTKVLGMANDSVIAQSQMSKEGSKGGWTYCCALDMHSSKWVSEWAKRICSG